MAKLGHTLRGAATGPLPSLAIRGGPTPGAGPLSGHRAKTPLATPIGEAPLHGQREPATPPPRPKGAALPSLLATHWPKEAPLTGPHWTTYRPKASHWPPMATASPTGQRSGRPPIGEPRPSLATHWPPTGHKGAAIGGRPSHLPSLAIREAPTGHKGTGGGRLRPALPDWPPKGA